MQLLSEILGVLDSVLSIGVNTVGAWSIYIRKDKRKDKKSPKK